MCTNSARQPMHYLPAQFSAHRAGTPPRAISSAGGRDGAFEGLQCRSGPRHRPGGQMGNMPRGLWQQKCTWTNNLDSQSGGSIKLRKDAGDRLHSDSHMVILDALVRLFCLRKICCIALSVSIPCLNVDKGFGNFRQVHISVLKDKWPRMKSLS